MSSSGAASDGGVPMPSHGCGQGTSCTPGNDLAAPAAADGFQFVLQSGQVTIQPNQEAYYCYYKTIPGSASIEVGAFQSWMSTGASHHFITYQADRRRDARRHARAVRRGRWEVGLRHFGRGPDHRAQDAGHRGPQHERWHAAHLEHALHQPDHRAALADPEAQRPLREERAVPGGTMVSFNAGIDVPPATAAGPGMQTVTGTCSAPVGSKFFAVTSHTHKHATDTRVNFVSGGQIDEHRQYDGLGVAGRRPLLRAQLPDGAGGRLVHVQLRVQQHHLVARARRRDGREQRDVHGHRVLLSGGQRELRLSGGSRGREAARRIGA